MLNNKLIQGFFWFAALAALIASNFVDGNKYPDRRTHCLLLAIFFMLSYIGSVLG